MLCRSCFRRSPTSIMGTHASGILLETHVHPPSHTPATFIAQLHTISHTSAPTITPTCTHQPSLTPAHYTQLPFHHRTHLHPPSYTPTPTSHHMGLHPPAITHACTHHYTHTHTCTTSHHTHLHLSRANRLKHGPLGHACAVCNCVRLLCSNICHHLSCFAFSQCLINFCT
jgi:hypothetical protein